jgi:hypothetical protein
VTRRHHDDGSQAGASKLQHVSVHFDLRRVSGWEWRLEPTLWELQLDRLAAMEVA